MELHQWIRIVPECMHAYFKEAFINIRYWFISSHEFCVVYVDLRSILARKILQMSCCWFKPCREKRIVMLLRKERGEREPFNTHCNGIQYFRRH